MSDEQFTMSDVWWGGMPAAAHHWRLAPHDSSLMYRHQQPATNTTLALSHQHSLTNVKGGSSRHKGQVLLPWLLWLRWMLPGRYLKSGGTVVGVKNSERNSATDTKRTSLAYFLMSGFTTCQAGWNTQGASTNSTWDTRRG